MTRPRRGDGWSEERLLAEIGSREMQIQARHEWWAEAMEKHSSYKEKVEVLLLNLSRLDRPEVTALITEAGL